MLFYDGTLSNQVAASWVLCTTDKMARDFASSPLTLSFESENATRKGCPQSPGFVGSDLKHDAGT